MKNLLSLSLSLSLLWVSFLAVPSAYAAYIAIDLGDNGPTPNHVNSPTPGPNNFQNFPVLTSAIRRGNEVTVTGTLRSVANSQFLIQFYANTADINEAQTLAGVTLTKTSGVNADFTAIFPHVPGSFFINATATFLKNSFPTDTSEMSANIPIVVNPALPPLIEFITGINQRLCVNSPGLLANLIDPDDPDGRFAIVRVVGNPLHGRVSVNPNGSFIYRPNRNFVGTDTFSIIAIDENRESNVATVVINVVPRSQQ